MKRYLGLLLSVLFVILSAMPGSAARPTLKYQVTFNGHPVLFDVQPEVVGVGTTMVPFRAIFEKMGAKVEYDDASKVVTATRDSTTIKLTIGSTTASVNGSDRSLPEAPAIKDGRTLIPLRFVSEAMGAEVKFDAATTAISIVDNNWPKRGGTLNLALWNKPTGKFNPIMWDDDYTSQVGGMMFEALWRFDERVIPLPALAESWEWDSTNTQLTFYLRKDVKFTNGTPLKAKDVVFTYKGIFHPKYSGPRNSGYEDVLGWEDYTKSVKGESNFESGLISTDDIEGLSAPDDYTVVWKLKQPNAVFLLGQTAMGILSSDLYKNVPVQDWGLDKDPNASKPIGTGPFIMDEYVEGQRVVMSANPNYWAGRPYVDRAIFRVLTSDVAVGEMQRGTLDFAEFNASEYAAFKALNNVTVLEFPNITYQYMGFNTVEGPTADKRVRQAIGYAIDRQSIIHNLLDDHGSAMYTPVHPLTWAFTDDVPQYNFDKAKAAQLLDEAGWKMGNGGVREKDGKKLHIRLTYPNVGNTVRIRTAPVVQQMLKDVGIEVELVGYDFATLLEKVQRDYDFDMFFLGFILGNTDPDPTGIWDKASIVPGGFNSPRWSTPRSEELIAKGKATNDIDERMAIYHEWQQLWADDLPAYLFYANNMLIGQNPRLQNFKPGVQGRLWNVEEFWLSN